MRFRTRDDNTVEYSPVLTKLVGKSHDTFLSALMLRHTFGLKFVTEYEGSPGIEALFLKRTLRSLRSLKLGHLEDFG